jgi:DHA3 family macrolide efflux protein-like MFS transporter
MAPSQLSFRDALKLKPLRRLWLAQLVSIFGDFLAIYAVFSMVSFRLRGTPTQVTLIMISFLLPLAFVGPVAGVFVDRWNVKATMIASDLIRAALALLLVLVTSPDQIYAILFALSAVSSFFLPAQSVTMRTLVPKEGLMAANALMSQALQITRIVSPAAAGALVAAFGEQSCFYLDTVSFLYSAAMVSTLVVARAPARAETKLAALLGDLTAGMKFIFTHAAVSFVIIAMTAGTFALSCFSALLAVYVRDVLKAGSVLFGSLGSLVGVGMILGTQFLNSFARERSKRHLVIFGLLAIGVCILLLAVFGTAPATAACTLGIGFSVAFLLIPAQTLLQTETPVAMLGRVSSSMISVLSLAQVAALALSGGVAQRIGIRNLYYTSAAMLVLIAVLGYMKLQKQAAAGTAVAGQAT